MPLLVSTQLILNWRHPQKTQTQPSTPIQPTETLQTAKAPLGSWIILSMPLGPKDVLRSHKHQYPSSHKRSSRRAAGRSTSSWSEPKKGQGTRWVGSYESDASTKLPRVPNNWQGRVEPPPVAPEDVAKCHPWHPIS